MSHFTDTRFYSILVTLGTSLIAALAISQIQTSALTESATLRFIATAGIVFIVMMLAELLLRRPVNSNRILPKGHAVDLPPVREVGTVKWFNADKGFGFIVRENGEDLFVHFRALEDLDEPRLIEGQQVEYQIGQGRKGPQAEQVVILD